MSSHDFLISYYQKRSMEVPTWHFVLGSGLSSAFEKIVLKKTWLDRGSVLFREIPGLTPSTAPGHKGLFRFYEEQASKKTILFQVGRLHGYEGLTPRDVVKPLVASFRAGTQNFILTNAAGALKTRFRVGSVMLIQDQVNFTGTNPLWGPNPTNNRGEPLGPRFTDLSQIYDPKIRQNLKKVFLKNRFSVNQGIYLGLLGPAYESPAEVALYAKWGLGAVGMSTVWEAIALKHLGATVGGLSFISNLGCGLSKKPLNHEDVEKIGQKVAPKLVESLFDFAESELKK